MTQHDERVYRRGWGWAVFDSDRCSLGIERVDDNCYPQSSPNYMTDETAEWLVHLLAASGNRAARRALGEINYSQINDAFRFVGDEIAD